MRVRPLTEEDLEEALDLFEAVAAEGEWLATEAPVDRREVRARWRDLLATDEGTILVAVEGGAIAGLSAVVGRVTPELGMLVRHDRRRRGVGESLLAAALAWARRRGAREVVLHVFRHNEAAIALYRKHGFEERPIPHLSRRRRGVARREAIRMVRGIEPGGAGP